jgi:acyl-CoA thioesterase-2
VTTSATADSLIHMLEVEALDKDLYRGYNQPEDSRRRALFGGQILAQALRAAARTVDPDRLPHSLHGYFLRPGSQERPVLLQVWRDRDGHSFSARRVAAIQNGEVIFNMSTSFHRREPGVQFVGELPQGAPHYDEVEEDAQFGRFQPWLRTRPILSDRVSEEGWVRSARMWSRVVQQLPDDPVLHACALAYISDVGSGFAETSVPGLPRGGPSIDHSLWFRDAVRADDWVLVELWPLMAGGARGVYAGAMRDASGRLAAMLTQEMLIRPASTPPPAAPLSGPPPAAPLSGPSPAAPLGGPPPAAP